jgi:hypothetical protein
MFSPVVASSAVFSARRAKRGADAIDENPVYGVMNMDIAAGQTLKALRAAQAIAVVADPSLKESMNGAANTIKEMSKSSKFVKGVGKVVSFTADHVNPLICVTSGIKVLGAEDKKETAIRETYALATMFGAEALAKEILGMPYTVKDKTTGQSITKNRDALYKKNPFLKKQVDALTDFCETKKAFGKISLKAVPGAGKGLLFVGASIGGYKLGTAIANAFLGKPEHNSQAC